MKLQQLSFFVTASLLLLVSCTTYYIPVDSFRKQFAGMDASKLRPVVAKSPWGITDGYASYPIDSILCVDKDGNNFKLKNGPSIEIRFTDMDNKKTVFYFDRLIVSHDTVTGVRSRAMPFITRSIALSTVKTIEVQDGGKKYHYVKYSDEYYKNLEKPAKPQ